MNEKNKGFHLVELLITIAIISVLVSVALPSFKQYITNSRRSEGISMLLKMMQNQERYYTETLTYTSDLSDLGYATSTVQSENGYFLIQASTCNTGTISTCVLLTATGQETMSGNVLTLNSRGERTPQDFWQ